MAEVELRLLGPVRALVDGHDVDIGGPRSRAVLATLGLARSGLTVERIVDGVWGAQPPDSAVRTARSYLSRLRSALGSETVVSVRGRYALDQRVSVDVDSFERDLGVEGDAAQQILALRHALALWDGDAPLVGGEPAERGAVEHLLDRRREARHRLALLLWQT
ncbi:MAG TPA: hypothetical protein VFL59_13685, partial [Candidatus Nanopelagicales bacterium]|nr:hypothetical protein [Candidatus Nanopelagicales bacterium]